MKRRPAKVKVEVAVRGHARVSVECKITVPLSRGDRSKVTAMLEHAAEMLLKGTAVSRPLAVGR